MQKDYNTTTCAQAGCFGQINKNGHFMLPALKIEFLFLKKSQASFIAHMKLSILYKIHRNRKSRVEKTDDFGIL